MRAPYLDQLGGNAHRDLRHGERVDRQADGCAYAVQAGALDACLEQVITNQLHLAAAADHANVLGIRIDHRRQSPLVVHVSASDDHYIRRPVDRVCTQRLLDVRGNWLDRRRQVLGVGEVLAVVHYDYAELQPHAQSGQFSPHVTGSGDQQDGGALHVDAVGHQLPRFLHAQVDRGVAAGPEVLDRLIELLCFGGFTDRHHGDVHRPPAEQPVLRSRARVKSEVEHLGCSGFEQGEGLLADFPLHAAAA